jgi:hypothetical protein
MPSNYQAITDNVTTLPKSNGDIDTDITFSAPGIRADRKPVLYYRINPDRNNVPLTVSINGVVVDSTRFGDVARTYHEVVGLDVVKPSGNTLTLKVGDNAGSIEVSDIVLLYQEQ